jgi:8-oxo-dGTP pyrophosphatase MutT (NUDIX family)
MMNKDNKTKSKSSGWQQLTTETVYENPWIKVSHDTVKTPSGSDGIYGRVHFKNHAVGILPIDEKGYTYLVKQTRYTLDCETWEIPEGGSPKGEDTLNTAKRELKEETGLSAKYWEHWMDLQLSNSVTDELGTIYLATGLTSGDLALDDSEDIVVHHLPFKKALSMVYKGEIVDVMSIAALLKAALDKRFKEFL